MADAAAAAARDAVEAGFAKLAPTLLEAITRLVGDPQRSRSPRPRAATAASIVEEEFPPLARRTRSYMSDGVSDLTIQRHSSGTAGHSVMSEAFSVESASPSSVATLYSIGRPMVQSLQADLAMAILDGSCYGSALRFASKDDTWRLSAERCDGRDAYDDIDRLDRIAPQQEGCVLAEPSLHQVKHIMTDGRAGSISSSAYQESGGRGSAFSQTSGMSLRPQTGRQVHHACIDALAQEATRSIVFSRSGSCRLSVFGTTPALTALRLAGLLQWDSARVPVLPLLYQWLVRVAIMLALVAFCLLAFRSEPVFDWTTNEFRQKCDDGTCWRSVSFSQLLLPIGALLAFVPLWLKRHQLRMEMTPAWCELSPSSVGMTGGRRATAVGTRSPSS